MAYVPGTEIEKPTVNLAGVTDPMEKVRRVKRALRSASVPSIVVNNFKKAAVGPSLQYEIDGLVALFAEVAE